MTVKENNRHKRLKLKKKHSYFMQEWWNKESVYLNFYLSRIALKQGKLFKSDLLLDKIHLGLVKRTKEDSSLVLSVAVKNVMPTFLLKNKKIGKRVILTPFFILSEHYRKLLGLKWIIMTALSKPGNFKENFINEVLDAFDNKGSVKKKTKRFKFIGIRK